MGYLNHAIAAGAMLSLAACETLTTNQRTAAGMAGGAAAGLITRYPASQLAEVVIGTAPDYAVGTHYPTDEEVSMLEEIRSRL